MGGMNLVRAQGEDDGVRGLGTDQFRGGLGVQADADGGAFVHLGGQILPVPLDILLEDHMVGKGQPAA